MKLSSEVVRVEIADRLHCNRNSRYNVRWRLRKMADAIYEGVWYKSSRKTDWMVEVDGICEKKKMKQDARNYATNK